MKLKLGLWEDLLDSRALLGILTLLILAGVWWNNATNMDVRIAYSGATPVEWNLIQTLPSHFQRDFPNGLAGYKSSFFMALYPVVSRLTGVSIEALMPWVIAGELLGMAAAILVWVRTIVPESRPVVLYTAILMVVTGYLQRLDISMFGFANFWGLYYTAAECAMLLAMTAGIRGRLGLAFLALSLATVIHPVIGLFGLVFVFATLLGKSGDLPWRRLAGWLLLYLSVVIPWFATHTERASYVGFYIPASEWFALTRLCGAHWYPFSYGMFAGIPPSPLYLLAYLLLFIHYARLEHQRGGEVRALAVGITAMLVLTVLGVFFSVVCWHPVLIKLALHRASGVAVLAALPIVSMGLWRDITEGGQLQVLVATLVLISPFLLNPGFPLTLVMLLTWRTWWPGLRGDACAYHRIGAMVTLACLAMLIYYSLHDYWVRLFEKLTKWRSYLFHLFAIYSLLGVGCVPVVRLGSRRLLASVALFLLTLSSSIWIYRNRQQPDSVHCARSYEEVQIWAKLNSPIDAVFMVDPGIYYGWRAYSQRSSFGNLRDWLYNWAYTSDPKHFNEGLRRFGEYSLNYRDYLSIFPSERGFEKLSEDVRARYYAFSDDQRRFLASKYGVSYFVLEKSRMSRPSHLERAFENADWIVLKVNLK